MEKVIYNAGILPVMEISNIMWVISGNNVNSVYSTATVKEV